MKIGNPFVIEALAWRPRGNLQLSFLPDRLRWLARARHPYTRTPSTAVKRYLKLNAGAFERAVNKTVDKEISRYLKRCGFLRDGD